MASISRVAAWAAASFIVASAAMAQENSECLTKITRRNVVSCALDASLSVRAEEDTQLALQGKRRAVSPLLPSNPLLTLTGARRAATSSERAVLNWSGTLSQELEIAGQRESRLRVADAELDAQTKRILLSKRETAQFAWSTYFAIAAAEQQQQLAERLLAASARVRDVARAKAEQGLGAPVDADVANAATLRMLQSKLAAERDVATASAELSFLLGRDASLGPLTVDGDLTPLAGLPEVAAVSSSSKLSERPELLALDAERRALEARARALSRARIPNPTLSVFAQNDGYNEHVVGIGVAFPIPLPTPLGRTYAGEITEAKGLAQRAATEQERAQRELQLGVARALADYHAHRQAVDAIEPAALQRAESSLQDLATEIAAGQLSVREALVSQQALLELLQTSIAEQKALCLASVELARALGVPLETGTR
jgi:cobalt-zinc-cadmium efflux system outer membrane protein